MGGKTRQDKEGAKSWEADNTGVGQRAKALFLVCSFIARRQRESERARVAECGQRRLLAQQHGRFPRPEEKKELLYLRITIRTDEELDRGWIFRFHFHFPSSQFQKSLQLKIIEARLWELSHFSFLNSSISVTE